MTVRDQSILSAMLRAVEGYIGWSFSRDLVLTVLVASQEILMTSYDYEAAKGPQMGTVWTQ